MDGQGPQRGFMDITADERPPGAAHAGAAPSSAAKEPSEVQPLAATETEEPQVQPSPDDREGSAEAAQPAEAPAAP
eukprot:8606744-Pyramimonas_sp.AAC.1